MKTGKVLTTALLIAFASAATAFAADPPRPPDARPHAESSRNADSHHARRHRRHHRRHHRHHHHHETTKPAEHKP